MQLLTVFSSPGRRPGRAIVLPPASALVLVLASALASALAAASALAKFKNLHLSFLCDGQGAVRRAVLSLTQVLLFYMSSDSQFVLSR